MGFSIRLLSIWVAVVGVFVVMGLFGVVVDLVWLFECAYELVAMSFVVMVGLCAVIVLVFAILLWLFGAQ